MTEGNWIAMPRVPLITPKASKPLQGKRER
jgi:hypothetical protein